MANDPAGVFSFRRPLQKSHPKNKKRPRPVITGRGLCIGFALSHTFMIDTRRVFMCASMASGPPSEP